MIEADAAWLPARGGGDFFGMAAHRMAWIDERQRVLAQNIANADTPRYEPRDVAPFAQWLQAPPVSPAQTEPRHLPGTAFSDAAIVPLPQARAPDGNAVDVETELTKVADDETQQALVGNLWKSTMSLYLDALGKSG